MLPQQIQTWVFDWEFNPLDFSVDLSDEEIYKRAIMELDAIANAKIHALSNCGVKAYRCSTEELIEMTRRYSCPVSADRFKLRDIVNSSFFDDIFTSDDVQRMSKRAAEESAENISLLSDMPLFGDVDVKEEKKKPVKKKNLKLKQRRKEKNDDSITFVNN